jgi:hypothetical protein
LRQAIIHLLLAERLPPDPNEQILLPSPQGEVRQRRVRRKIQDHARRGFEFSSKGTECQVSREAGGLANLRLARAALALEQFRAEHKHRYPAALTELTPVYLEAITQDPYDGQPLRYPAQGPGYVLYSIGPDLKDDGGERMKGRGGDLVFAIVTPP